MAVGILWYAQMAHVSIGGSITTPTTASPLFVQLAATVKDWTGRVSNVAVRGGSRDAVAVNTLGIVQLQHNQRPEIVTAEFTLIYEGDSSAAYIAGSPISFNYTGTLASTGTYSRYQYGEKSTAATDRAVIAVCFTLDNGATGASNKTVYVTLNNAVCTSREFSLAADGYLEEKWTIKCLAQNYYEEDNFST